MAEYHLSNSGGKVECRQEQSSDSGREANKRGEGGQIEEWDVISKAIKTVRHHKKPECRLPQEVKFGAGRLRTTRRHPGFDKGQDRS
ncbi:hypothetical protein RRF57_009144 [Xylaria bambusicola]|uniref:Uncharacterized protein n=1 Tax=Xylaria bambusicola TaxID=326684 RepID=A0AAN7UJ35_9PEZI